MSARILLVDDDKSVRMTLSEALEHEGYEVTAAVDGEHALEKADEEQFDLVLLDMNLPGIGGLEVLKKLKQKAPKEEVIMITGYGTVETAVEAMKMGACDFIQKPFSPQEIRSLVKKVLERRDLPIHPKDSSYETSLEYAKKAITLRDFTKADNYLRKAIQIDPKGSEAFNLLGVIVEAKGNLLEAQRLYRAALALDPSYRPALSNLERTVTFGKRKDPLDLDSFAKDKESDSRCTES